MENKVTMQQLSAMLAIATGKQKKLCEDFVKEVCRIVSDELERGENVRIKGFGTFKLVEVDSRKSVNVTNGEEYEIPGHKKVIFVAAKELALAVNAPFEAFEAVEVSDDISNELLLEDGEEFEDEPIVIAPRNSAYTPYEVGEETGVAGGFTSGGENKPEGFSGIEEPDHVTDQESNEVELPVYDSEENDRKGKFGWGFLCGFIVALAVCALVWWCWGRPYFAKGEVIGHDEVNLPMDAVDVGDEDSIGLDSILADTDEAGDSITDTADDAVPTQPSDQPVYDTISTTRFLTTMAKEHYGNFNLWPIIYEENKAILGHPDRIRPGTRVVVPPLKKYGIDASNEEDIKRIKQQGLDIYSRYK